MESGTGGPKESAPKKLSYEEAAKIRAKDYRKYLQLLKEGKIEEDL